jgi:excisionase family DNA binding protein
MTDRLMTAEELAERWQVLKGHVYELTRRGEIPAVKLGKYYRYRLDAIERFELDGRGHDTIDDSRSGRGDD